MSDLTKRSIGFIAGYALGLAVTWALVELYLAGLP